MLQTSHFIWPPRGWKQLGEISRSHGQSMIKDIQTARIHGVSYTIKSDLIYQAQQSVRHYTLTIDAWEYSILNESKEYSVLSFDVSDRVDLLKPREQSISDIRIFARPLREGRQNIRRALTAAVFLIRQIDLGQVPDVDRVLSLYHLKENIQSPFLKGVGMTPRTAPAEALMKSWKEI